MDQKWRISAIQGRIGVFCEPTSSGRKGAGASILDGFEKVFLRNVRKTEIDRMALAEEIQVGSLWADESS